MPAYSQKENLTLTNNQRSKLRAISRSRKASVASVERAKILLYSAKEDSISLIARRLGINRGKVDRCVKKAFCMGMEAALNDLPRSGKPAIITEEAVAWLISIACCKPKDFGFSYELWTTRLLQQYIQDHCKKAGYPCLRKIGAGTVSKILNRHKLKPHKVSYYLELRDPKFDKKMKKVVQVYRQAQDAKKRPAAYKNLVFISYDEKPGIQAIQNTAPDLPPVPGKYAGWSRDHEYKRLGTMSLLAGINLVSGKAHHLMVDRHRSREFILFLRQLIASYPPKTRFRIILDNHSAHISKETQDYLATVPNRFEFIFTPVHASWLNLVEVFFSKMARSVLREMRVDSKKELKSRIRKFFAEVNKRPVPYTWKYMIKTDRKPKVDLKLAA
jgi:transposase